MPTRNVKLTDDYDQFREDEEQLAALRELAAEGFAELDRGQGTAIEDSDQLRDLIGQIGRRAANEVERRKTRR